MWLFSFFKRKKRKIESNSAIEVLKKWEQQHFKGNNIKTSHAYKFNRYRGSTGMVVDLAAMKIPEPERSLAEKIFKEISNLLDGKIPPTKSNMALLVADTCDKFHKEISCFRNNFLTLEQLRKDCTDSFFEQIDHIFCVKLKMLYSELLLCEFERLDNLTYFQKIYHHIMTLLNDIKQLNCYFSDYMRALTNLTYEDTSFDLQQIRIQVKAMAEVAENKF